jgi:hypothetical protein
MKVIGCWSDGWLLVPLNVNVAALLEDVAPLLEVMFAMRLK